MRYMIAVELGEEFREQLGLVRFKLDEEFGEVSWLGDEQLFLNVKFLGGLYRKRHGLVKKVLRQAASFIAPFEIQLWETGCFPASDPVRTIWATVTDSSSMMARFRRECDNRYQDIGVREDDRDFVPHVTLGRVPGKYSKGPLRKRVEEVKFEGISQPVRDVCLVESKLSKTGAEYKIVYRAPLTAQIAS